MPDNMQLPAYSGWQAALIYPLLQSRIYHTRFHGFIDWNSEDFFGLHQSILPPPLIHEVNTADWIHKSPLISITNLFEMFKVKFKVELLRGFHPQMEICTFMKQKNK
jgi:hypothetical protein